MGEIEKKIARRIIEKLGGSGTPPEFGLEHFSAGLEPYLDTIEEEYLSGFIKEGGSSFKMVVEVYGGGKTHFLYCVRDLAWKNNFATSYVSLSPGESPFHRLDLVYAAIIRGLIPPIPTSDEQDSPYSIGVRNFIKSLLREKHQQFKDEGFSGESLQEELINYIKDIKGVESLSFLKAVRSAYLALLNNDEESFETICQWLSGEKYDSRTHKKHGILQRIDKTTAFQMIRSLAQWVREIGYSGLVVLLDEAERVPSLSTKQMELHLSNLREVIDECSHVGLQGVMFFYAVPDDNFLEGRTQVYEALKQRVKTEFDIFNPTGVSIELKRISDEPLELLKEIGRKLRVIFDIAHDCHLDEKCVEDTIDIVAERSYQERFGDLGYKRVFVQNIVRGFFFIRKEKRTPSYEELVSD